jgi:hypothetical protein
MLSNDQIRRHWNAIVEGDAESEKALPHHAWRFAKAILAEALAAQATRIAELERDAGRWKFAKSHFFRMMSPDMGGNHDWVANGRGVGRGNTLDAAVDARIAAQAGSQGDGN